MGEAGWGSGAMSQGKGNPLPQILSKQEIKNMVTSAYYYRVGEAEVTYFL